MIHKHIEDFLYYNISTLSETTATAFLNDLYNHFAKSIEEYNCKTIEDVQKYINIGQQCGHCLPEVQRILNEINKE